MCQWNKDHQQPYVRTFDGNLDDLKIQLRTAMKFNSPTYDDWLAERNLMEKRACAEIKSIDLAKSSLLSILEFTGEDIPALSFRLPPSKRQRRDSYTTQVTSMAQILRCQRYQKSIPGLSQLRCTPVRCSNTDKLRIVFLRYSA
jgi:hypothetical protein